MRGFVKAYTVEPQLDLGSTSAIIWVTAGPVNDLLKCVAVDFLVAESGHQVRVHGRRVLLELAATLLVEVGVQTLALRALQSAIVTMVRVLGSIPSGTISSVDTIGRTEVDALGAALAGPR